MSSRVSSTDSEARVPWRIVGAGGQGRVVLEALRSSGIETEIAFLDDNPELHGSSVLGAPVLGPLTQLEEFAGIVVLALGDNLLRLRIAQELAAQGARFGVAQHASAIVSPTASIGDGSVILPRAVVHTGAIVQQQVVVNTGAIVEHDCVLENGASVSPGVCMGGRARVGEGAFLSTGVTLAARAEVGAGAIVGAGAVVVGKIPRGMLAYGVPAKPVRKVDPETDFRRVL